MSLTTGSLAALGDTPSAEGTPVVVYERVGRGALGCWFGAHGPLSRTHQYTAEVAPPSQTASAEIVIFEKDPATDNARSTRAYRITLAAEGTQHTRLSIQNIKLPGDLAEAMRKDVAAWAGDKAGCEAQIVRPPPPEPDPVVLTKKKRPKKKSRV